MSPKGQSSIYVRLMPLMYALIGASATLFLHTLFCGRPPRAKECAPARVAVKVAPATSGGAADGAPRPPADIRPRARAVADAAAPVIDGSREAGARGPRVPDAKLALVADDRPATPPDGRGVAPTRPASAPASTRSLEQELAAAIQPCARAKVRRFRLGVRLHPDGKVRRVFVTRAPGVNGTMVECIKRQLGALSLLEAGAHYLEWLVRQPRAGALSLRRARPGAR